MPTRDAVGRTRSPFYGPESFTYLPESNSYICPGGQQLNYGGRNERNRTFGYIGTRKKCGPCQRRIPVHDWTVPVSCDPHEQEPLGSGRERSLDFTGVQVRTTATEEGRGALRGAKESQSHRSQSAPAAQVEVRTRTVLPGGHRPEHQAAGPVPEPTDTITNARQRIVAGTDGNIARRPFAGSKSSNGRRLFQHPRTLSLARLPNRDHLWAGRNVILHVVIIERSQIIID